MLAHFGVEPAARIFAAGFSGERQSPLAETFFENIFLESREIGDLVDAQEVQILFHHFADAGNIAHIERREELRFLPRDDPQHAIGLGLGRGNFRDQPRGANSDGAVQLCFRFHLVVQGVCGAQWRPVQAIGSGHVEIRLVDRSHLHQWRERVQHFIDLGGTLAIAVGMAIYENRVRTEFGGRAQGHGRVHAELAGLIGCGRDDAAFIALSAHHHGFSFQRRIRQFLHRHEEGVHVDVEDGLCAQSIHSES